MGHEGDQQFMRTRITHQMIADRLAGDEPRRLDCADSKSILLPAGHRRDERKRQQEQNDENRRDALLYLLAASRSQQTQPGDAPLYPPLRLLLARQYWRYSQFQLALQTMAPAPLEIPTTDSSPRAAE